MSPVSRGVRNAFRNTIRSGSIIVILALSIGLIIAMLAARQAVADRIQTVKQSVGNTVSISPAGVRGFEGGGEALTSAQIKKVEAVAHVSSVTSSLSDRLTTGDTTSLKSSIELGSLGKRRANENDSANGGANQQSMPQSKDGSNSSKNKEFNPQASVTINGINDTTSQTIWGGTSVTFTSGTVFDGTSNENVAVVGKALAKKNNLKVGSTLTAYGEKLKVVAIYDAGNTFANNGLFVPLKTEQRLSDQSGSVTSATANVDSLDNVSSATKAISTALGDDADVTNSQTETENTIKPLESVKTIAFFSLVGAVVAGAVVILLTMMMIVRERRREIGVMKAIGASNVGIVFQFVVESLTLTAAGLVIGAVIGIAASTPLTNALVTTSSSSTSSSQQNGPGVGSNPGSRGPAGFGGASTQTVKNITSSVGIGTLAYGIGATLLIAIIGSAIPAMLIAKIKPAEAMRSE